MNLVIWIPAMFILALLALGLMFAFIGLCARV